MTRRANRLARRYAQACVQVYGDSIPRNVIYDSPMLVEDLKRIQALLSLAEKCNERAAIKDAFLKLFQKHGWGAEFSGPLLDLIADHNRFRLLPLIVLYVYKAYLEKYDVMDFMIESAIELTDDEATQVVSLLKEKTGKEIRYTLEVVPELIAGIKVYSDTLGFEYSVRRRLSLLALVGVEHSI